MSDPDGDSQMPSASSSSDEADSEAMFPAELDPPASVAQNQVNSIDEQSSSFTPPQSQDVGEAMDTSAAQANHSAPESWSNMSGQNLGEEAWVPQSEFARSAADAQFEPGAGWNNKKAREEYQRAMAVIEDKSFSLSKMQFHEGYATILIKDAEEFGDLFDETQEQQPRGNE